MVVVGNPAGRRVELLQAALAGLGAPPARVVAHADLLAGRATLAGSVAAGSVLRIESPDRDFEVERSLIALGADEPDDEAVAGRIGRAAALRLEFDKGRILHPRQWFLGLRALMRRLDAQRRECPPHVVMNAPADVVVLFDKPRCHALFGEHGVPTPRGLGTPRGYDDLRDRMERHGMSRVFVKLASGSSASGVLALETDGHRVRATSTVEAVRGGGGLRLYNTRKLRRYGAEPEIAEIVDVLARERVHVEQWVPKASLPGGAFDLRVVVIAGRAAHRIARQGPGPMTNLHLLNNRLDPELVRARMAPADWAAALASCERAAAIAPGSLYAGIDLVIAAGFRRHVVLEANAFGDLLPGVAHDGADTYAAELLALRRPGEAA